MLEMTPEVEALLSSVNRQVNRGITYRADPKGGDSWIVKAKKLPTGKYVLDGSAEGDCDDYAVTKKAILMGEGIPRNDLRLTLCWVEDQGGRPGKGGYHMVLMAMVGPEPLILDNRSLFLRKMENCPYRWHQAEDPFEGGWQYFLEFEEFLRGDSKT